MTAVPPEAAPALTGAAVRQERDRLGLTQYELARLAGTSQGTVSSLETGRRCPGPGVLSAIAAVLEGCRPAPRAGRPGRPPAPAVPQWASAFPAARDGAGWQGWRNRGPGPLAPRAECGDCGAPAPDHRGTCTANREASRAPARCWCGYPAGTLGCRLEHGDGGA